MATIVTRAGKGSPLTHNEVDANFTNLNTDKAETSSLATVATTGAYSDLTGTPTLGTAAAADTGDFVAQTSATGAASIPSGTEAQRPTPAAGQLRFNTDAGTFEGYDGTEWGAIAGGGEASLLNYNFTATAGQTTFSGADDNSATLSYTQQNLIVTLNGIVLEDGTDYTASNGTSIVLASGAAAGDELNVVAFKSFTVADMVPASTGGTFSGNVTVDGDIIAADKIVHDGDTSTAIRFPAADTVAVETAGAERMRITSTGNVGIGTISPAEQLHVQKSAAAYILAEATGASNSGYRLKNTQRDWYILNNATGAFDIYDDTAASIRMTIDASGNLLVGKTVADNTTDGATLFSDGTVSYTANLTNPAGGRVAVFNRRTADGAIVDFRKDGTTVGSIGTREGGLYIGSTDGSDAFLAFFSNQVSPSAQDGSARDNVIDLGSPFRRFDDIYATNGTIQTSDRNEKQDIEALSDAEQRVAVAAKGLLRKYRWKDAVAEKGDAARIHFGIIAQDLQAAFEAEGLDAGRYGMFISSTWWEAEVEKNREVEQEDGTTVTETYTATETYDEPTEGATERTRMGVRYPELLAFIIAAL